MGYKISRETVKDAVDMCASVYYPITVNGQDFGDALGLALAQVIELSKKVEQLEKVIEKQLENNNE